jgi:SAM-dependent methyltransferase
MTQYSQISRDLRAAYDKSAGARDSAGKAPWKVAERVAFLERMQSEQKRTLLEVGAGTGQDSSFFRGNDIDVVATDPSPEMVKRCQLKGLDARVADVLDLPDARFDAVYSFNVLLHVPNADISRALASVANVLRPDGLFFLGVYGGESFEGKSVDDWHDPPRFFSFRTDDELQRLAGEHFEVVDFHVVEPQTDGAVASGATGSAVHFQSLTVRKLGD